MNSPPPPMVCVCCFRKHLLTSENIAPSSLFISFRYECVSEDPVNDPGTVEAQFRNQAYFYSQLQSAGFFINAPDFYFAQGINKEGVGYAVERGGGVGGCRCVDVWMCGCEDGRRVTRSVCGVRLHKQSSGREGWVAMYRRTASEGSIDDSKCSNSWYTPCRSFIFRYNENTFSLPRQMQNLVARANVYEHYAHYPWYIKWFIRCAPS